jgi:hypothetical protein
MAMTISGDGSITGLVAGGLPDETIVTADIADLNVTPAKLSQKLTSGTAVSASGTAIDYTGIPSWVKRITVMFQGLSTNGSSNIQIQLGSGSFTTSGYLGTSAYYGSAGGAANFTTGLPLSTTSSSDIRHGTVVISNISNNNWVSSHTNGQSNNAFAQFGGGSISLSGILDRVRITMVNGTDQFDAGSINILYEG